MRGIIVLFLLAMSGCASTAQRNAAAEAHGYERGYRQAVKEQYWIIQNQQRRPTPAEPTPPTP